MGFIIIVLIVLFILYVRGQNKSAEASARERRLDNAKRERELAEERERASEERTRAYNERLELEERARLAAELAEIQHRESMEKEAELKEQMSSMYTRTKSRVEEGHRDGYIYVLSNKDSFGEDIYKVGMTRRAKPSKRIKELNNASVPFEFDVHAMVPVLDAADTEGDVHDMLDSYRTNKNNNKKEFFTIEAEELITKLSSKGLDMAGFHDTMKAGDMIPKTKTAYEILTSI